MDNSVERQHSPCAGYVQLFQLPRALLPSSITKRVITLPALKASVVDTEMHCSDPTSLITHLRGAWSAAAFNCYLIQGCLSFQAKAMLFSGWPLGSDSRLEQVPILSHLHPLLDSSMIQSASLGLQRPGHVYLGSMVSTCPAQHLILYFTGATPNKHFQS